MGKIIEAKLSDKAKKIKKAKVVSPASDDAMEKLIAVMTNQPTIVKLANAGWPITALKPAVQWRIAQKACNIHKVEKATFGDVIMGFSTNLPSIVEVVTLALLNDKKRIEEEYDKVYDTLMWESKPEEWATLLYEILKLLDVGFFFQITQTIDLFRQTVLQKKMTMEEQKLSLQGQNGEK